MTQATDVLVIGAGAAGLSAAKAAQEMGLSVTILDEQPEPGGQIYRSVGRVKDQRLAILGDDYTEGRALLDVLANEAVTLIDSATVWDIDPAGCVYYSRDDQAATITTQHIIIATGAMERPMPFPGWQLPGVMTAGGAQILLKSASVLPSAPAVLVGSGPLLLLLAVQYTRAGFDIEALVETTPTGAFARVRRHLMGAVKAHKYLRKGTALLAEIKKVGVSHYKGATELRAIGDDAVTALEFTADGQANRIDCQTLLIHNGVVPNVQLTRLLGLEHDWDSVQRYFKPRIGAFGETSIETVSIAGDTAGIGGAELAARRGYLAGLNAAHALGRVDADALRHHAIDTQREMKYYEGARPFIDAMYVPDPALLNPVDDTIVCRCEEITAGTIRELVDQGCLGPNQTKAYGRCGMGPCQGRQCGLTVAEIIAARRGVAVDEVGYYTVRPPIKPVTLGELATVDQSPNSNGADEHDSA